MKSGTAHRGGWAGDVLRAFASARGMRAWIAVAAVFAVLLLASSPGLAGHAHGTHDVQLDAGTAGSIPIAATCGQVEAGAKAAISAVDPHEHHHHPCGSNDAGCKRISSCVSCVSAIASTADAMLLPYAVRSLRKAPDAVMLAGVPPGKLQRPPKPFS